MLVWFYVFTSTIMHTIEGRITAEEMEVLHEEFK